MEKEGVASQEKGKGLEDDDEKRTLHLATLMVINLLRKSIEVLCIELVVS